jgi:ribosomal protein L32
MPDRERYGESKGRFQVRRLPVLSGPMLWKILLLIAIIVAVLYGFRMISRASDGRQPAARKTRKKGRGTESDGQAVDLVKCGNCGAFTAPGTPCSNCGQ